MWGLLIFLPLMVLGHEPSFFPSTCSPSTSCSQTVDDPGLSQVFYERIEGNSQYEYDLTWPEGSDDDFLLEFYYPEKPDLVQCSHVQYVVRDSEGVIVLQKGMHPTGPLFHEGWTQMVMTRDKQPSYVNSSVFLRQKTRITLLSDAFEGSCRFALVLGKREELSVVTLLTYPYISVMTWIWGIWMWVGIAAAAGGGLLSIIFCALFYYARQKRHKGDAEGLCSWEFFWILGIFFYLLVLLTRTCLASYASIVTDKFEWPYVMIGSVEALFVLSLVFLYVFARDLRSRGVLAGSLFIALASLFAFSPGFYLGPLCYVIYVIGAFLSRR